MHELKVRIKKINPLGGLKSIVAVSILALNLSFGSNKLAISIVSLVFLSAFLSLSLSVSQDISLNVLVFLSFLTLTLFVPMYPVLNIAIALSLTFTLGGSRKPLDTSYWASLFGSCLIAFLAINLIYELSKKYIGFTLQFLTFGYDNAFHLSLFRQFNSAGHFHYPFSDSGWSDFDLFKKYPTGQAALYSVFSKVMFNYPKGFIEEIAAFFTLIVVCLSLIFIFSLKIVSINRITALRRDLPLILILIGSVFVFPGVIVVNGYPPYLFGLVIILICLVVQDRNEDFFRQSLKIGATIFLLTIVCPAGLFFIFVPTILFLGRWIRSFRIHLLRRCHLLQILPILLYSWVSFLVLGETSANLGWRQIYAGGGIQPLNYFGAAVIFFLSLMLAIKQFKSLVDNIFFQVYLSGTLSTLALIAITVIFTGNIQYYAIKQVYLWQFVSSVFICFLLHRFSRHLGVPSKSFTIIILSGALVFTSLVPKVFLGGFMGIPLNAIKHTFQSESWSSEVVDGRSIYERAKLANRANQDCLIMISRGGESDLNSRWLNSVDSDGLVTEACFAMYWNTSNMTLTDRISLASRSKLRLFIYVPKEVFNLSDDNLPNNVIVVKY
jgi:hypothetical protein